MENAFTKTTSEVLKHFSVSESKGLTEAQISASREKFGRNGKLQASTKFTFENS